MKPLDPLDLTRRLVNIESLTYNEGAVGEYLDWFLRERGFVVERMAVPQPAQSRFSGARFNVYAGTGERPDVVLSTHMDTVPPFIPSSEDDDFLYGRGACDAKGIIAAQVAAVERLREAGVATGLLLVVGEERDSAGARVANQHAKGSRFLINGEPTDNRLALASKGTLRAEIRARGAMAHSAYPELGDNAVHKLIAALHRLLAIDLPFVEGIGPSTLNIGLIEGGRAPNVISDLAVAQVMVRLVGPSEETREAIRLAVGDLAEVEFTLEIPFIRMRQVEGLETMVAAFTTDIPALTNWGEPLLMGPGSIHVAHTPFEKIAKSELLKAVDLYYEVENVSPDKMKSFGWMKRLKYGLVAALGAWLSGWVVSLPFEFSQAWRYVDGNVRELPVSLAKGMVVWAGFSLFMATAGFLMLGLPAILLIPPLWFVRWRRILIPAAPLVALVAIDKRMGLLHRYYFLHPKPVEIFFFTAPTFFVMTFALTVVWLYAALAGRRGHSVTGGPT